MWTSIIYRLLVTKLVLERPLGASDHRWENYLNPLNPELNPICYLLALLAHHFLHVSRIRVKSLTLRLLMQAAHLLKS